jgi:predicted GIY-YIG superfamily endonuclease
MNETPAPVQHSNDAFLYRAFDDGDRLLYVGITDNMFRRLMNEHSASAKWIEYASRLDITQFPSKREARQAEVVAIKTEGPIFNRNGRARAVWFADLANYVGQAEAERLSDPVVWARPGAWDLGEEEADRLICDRRTKVWTLLYPDTTIDR